MKAGQTITFDSLNLHMKMTKVVPAGNYYINMTVQLVAPPPRAGIHS